MEESLRAKLLANDELIVEEAENPLLFDAIQAPPIGRHASVATSRGTAEKAVRGDGGCRLESAHSPLRRQFSIATTLAPALELTWDSVAVSASLRRSSPPSFDVCSLSSRRAAKSAEFLTHAASRADARELQNTAIFSTTVRRLFCCLFFGCRRESLRRLEIARIELSDHLRVKRKKRMRAIAI